MAVHPFSLWERISPLVIEVRYFYLRITRTVLCVMKLTSFPLAEWRECLIYLRLKTFLSSCISFL